MDTDILLTFGINLIYYRQQLNLSQDELCFITTLKKSYISDIQKKGGVRNISLQNVEKLSQALEIPPYKFFIGDDIDMNYNDEIKTIIVEEFSKLIINIENDFKTNYKKKNHNFLLSQLDPEMTAHMVFVSSFESKSGNSIQECARKIATLKFGPENVPNVVNPHNLPFEASSTFGREQIIVTDVDYNNETVQGSIQSFITANSGGGRGKSKKECTTTQESIKNLLDLSSHKSSSIHIKPVDLAFYDGLKWNIMEIKAGGDLDSSNAPGNVKKMLTLYVALNDPTAELYFSTIYHKTGEGNTWTGAVKQYLSYPNMFLIGSNFWNKILPADIDFEQFCGIYKEAIEEIDLNQRLKDMITDCIS